MSLADHLRRGLAWTAWADLESLHSIKEMATPAAHGVRVIAHIVACERLWLGRIKADARPVVVWPDWALDQSVRELEETSAAWREFGATLNDDVLARRVAYVNSLGESWNSTVEDIVSHVISHGAYHRGQIAGAVRRTGGAPAYTDFIHAVRRGLI
jgi:uncharacterized damage-inducible protein DinB